MAATKFEAEGLAVRGRIAGEHRALNLLAILSLAENAPAADLQVLILFMCRDLCSSWFRSGSRF